MKRVESTCGAITDVHLLINASSPQYSGPVPIDHPAAGLDNHNEQFEVHQLCSELELMEYMPLTFALAQTRGGWSTLNGNVCIKRPLTPDPARLPCSADSWMQLVLPFSSNDSLFARYRMFQTDRVRLGKLMEDFDALAADIAYRHLGPKSVEHFIVVTAAMDRLELHAPVLRSTDLIISGSVTSVGSTSMDVRLWVEALSTSGRVLIMQAIFSMVCRDKHTYAAATVPRLCVVTPFDQWACQDGVSRRARRRSKAERDLNRVPPTPDESTYIHNLLTNRPRDTLCIPASKTVINTIEAMHVQERNVHNKIFGGTLMRMSYEIAVTCAFNACAVFPVLVAMDDVSFVAPVEIGSILNLRASVTYICTERKLCFVVVEASMINTSNPNLQPGGQLLDKQRKLTNECHFAFRVDSKLALPQIVPESYAEILSYLDSRRREADLPMLH